MKRLAIVAALTLAACQVLIGSYDVGKDSGAGEGGAGEDGSGSSSGSGGSSGSSSSGSSSGGQPADSGGSGDGTVDGVSDGTVDGGGADGSDDGPGDAACNAAACDLTDQDGCAPDCGGPVCGCVLLGASVACVPMGSTLPGSSCTTDDECMPGFTCQGQKCAEWCTTSAGQCGSPPGLCQGTIGGACGVTYRYCQ